MTRIPTDSISRRTPTTTPGGPFPVGGRRTGRFAAVLAAAVGSALAGGCMDVTGELSGADAIYFNGDFGGGRDTIAVFGDDVGQAGRGHNVMECGSPLYVNAREGTRYYDLRGRRVIPGREPPARLDSYYHLRRLALRRGMDADFFVLEPGEEGMKVIGQVRAGYPVAGDTVFYEKADRASVLQRVCGPG